MAHGSQIGLIAATALALSCSGAIAGGTGWWGAVGGTLQDLSRSQSDHDAQRQFITQQHELEMQRIDLEQQLRRDESARQTEIRNEQQRRQEQSEIEKVDRAHPEWRDIVRSEGYKKWIAQQPDSVKRIEESSWRAEDAILIFDLYKRDTAPPAKIKTSPQKITDPLNRYLLGLPPDKATKQTQEK